MPKKSKVVVLKTKPNLVLEDYSKLMHLANYKKFLSKRRETILKLNLSWSLYFPACSTEPWQLEGVLKTMLDDGYKKIHPVENRTVVTDVWKGAIGNKWLPILKKYKQKYEPLTETKWIPYKPKSEMLALYDIFPDGLKIPEMFPGKNIVHLPTIKCIHSTTEIMLNDGSLVKIKNLVGEIYQKNETIITKDRDTIAYSNHYLPTLSVDGKITEGKATQFWKTPSPKKVYKITTKTGREVIVSEEHPFLTPQGWKKAKGITKRTRIAIPRKIKIKGKYQPLPKIITLGHKEINLSKIPFKKGKKYSINTQKEIIKKYLVGKTSTKIAKELKTHPESIRNILLRYNIPIRWVRKWVIVPKKTSVEFWKWMGYFLAEGYAKECKGSMRFWWGSDNKNIINEYKKLTKELFGIEPKVKRSKGRIDIYYFDCNHLIPFFKELGLSLPLIASKKKVPPLLFKCPNEEIAAFLQTYFDGDGTVSTDGFHAVSKSKQLIEKIQLLLARLGIISFIKSHWSIAYNSKMKKKKIYWMISIYSDDLVTLSKYIKFHSKNKQKNMEKLVEKRKKSIKKPSNWDTIPINPEIFRKVREGLGLTQQSSGKPSSINSIENNHSLPTRPIFNYFIKLFEKKDKKNKFKEEIDYFKFLASGDITWDYITNIKKIKSNISYLYDLSVPKTGNFIGNGIILHNTHGHTVMTGAMKNAFGGLITKRRHHCHKKIHEILVDLLQIQKEIHPGIFAVMDGTVCGDGAGPRTMTAKIKNYILASADQVAIDAVSAKMMGFDPMKIKFIKLAHDLNLGCGDIDQIDVIGEDISNVNFKFRTKRSLVVFFDQVLRTKYPILEPILFHTSLFKLPILGSALYHDYFWYPLIGKIKIKKFMQTKWGKLFQGY